MPSTVLFAIILVAGLLVTLISRKTNGVARVLLLVIGLVMTVLSAFGLVTALLP